MAGFAGYDCSGFPGLAITGWLRSNTNLHWSGFYLAPAPSHKDASWMANRAALVEQGWGLAPLYVGEQTIPPGSMQPSGSKGTTDGNDAVALLKKAGFVVGTFVYLDLENGKPFTPLERDYVGNWVDTVSAAGFGPGVYCSHTFAGEVHALKPAARLWVFKVPTVAVHVVPGNNFPDSHPAGSGVSSAFIWQLAQNALIDAKAPQKLKVDLDTALTPDPGQ